MYESVIGPERQQTRSGQPDEARRSFCKERYRLTTFASLIKNNNFLPSSSSSLSPFFYSLFHFSRKIEQVVVGGGASGALSMRRGGAQHLKTTASLGKDTPALSSPSSLFCFVLTISV